MGVKGEVAAQGLSQTGGRERGQGPLGSQNTAALGAFTCGTKRETEARSGGRQGADPREPRVQDRNPDLPPTPERLSGCKTGAPSQADVDHPDPQEVLVSKEACLQFYR